MITQKDLDDLRQDKLNEQYQDERHEYAMSTDWDYCLDYIGLTPESTLLELNKAYNICKSYGWEPTITELINSAGIGIC